MDFTTRCICYFYSLICIVFIFEMKVNTMNHHNFPCFMLILLLFVVLDETRRTRIRQ